MVDNYKVVDVALFIVAQTKENKNVITTHLTPSSLLQTKTKKQKKKTMTIAIVFFFSSRRKKNIEKKKKCKEGRELTFLLMLVRLGWSAPLAFSSPRSFNVELSSFLKPCVLCLLKVLSYSSLGALPSFVNEMRKKWGEGGRREEVDRRGKFWGKEGAEKSLGKGRGCVFSSSPKWLQWPHPELVH